LICFDKAIKLDPSFWGTYYGKIHTLSEIDKHEDVLKIIEDALKEISDDRYKYLIFTAKGDALFSLHRYHEGLAVYDVAIGYDKKYANAYIGKLKCLEALNIVGDADYYFKLLKSGYCHFNERGPAVMMECIPSQYLQ
jgi:tetratricopeptide (TPR) repeat protein